MPEDTFNPYEIFVRTTLERAASEPDFLGDVDQALQYVRSRGGVDQNFVNQVRHNALNQIYERYKALYYQAQGKDASGSPSLPAIQTRASRTDSDSGFQGSTEPGSAVEGLSHMSIDQDESRIVEVRFKLPGSDEQLGDATGFAIFGQGSASLVSHTAARIEERYNIGDKVNILWRHPSEPPRYRETACTVVPDMGTNFHFGRNAHAGKQKDKAETEADHDQDFDVDLNDPKIKSDAAEFIGQVAAAGFQTLIRQRNQKKRLIQDDGTAQVESSKKRRT